MVLLILMIITIGYNGGCSTALPPHYLKIIDPNIITDTYTEVTCLSRGWATGSVIASPWTIWCRHQSPLFAPFFILQKKEDRRSRSPFGAIAYPPENHNEKGRVFFLYDIIFLLFHCPHLIGASVGPTSLKAQIRPKVHHFDCPLSLPRGTE